MGLDITAYSKLKFVEAATYESLKAIGWEHPLSDSDDHVLVAVAYEEHSERLGAMIEGFYKKEGTALGFRAGSYSGYNRWREQLAALVGTTTHEVWRGDAAAAFGDLIDFSDCEGSIGADVSAKLARDFADWQPKAEAYATSLGISDGLWFLEKYNDWRKAFELAADGGAVRFH